MFKVKLAIYLANPSIIPLIMSEIEGILKSNRCTYTKAPSWTIGVCGDSLVKVRVPLEPPKPGIPPTRSVIEVLLESRDPQGVYALTSAINSMTGKLRGAGIGITLES